jgi:hypothetical protein
MKKMIVSLGFLISCQDDHSVNMKSEIIEPDEAVKFTNSFEPHDLNSLKGIWYLRKTEIRPSGKKIASTSDSLFYRNYPQQEDCKIHFFCSNLCIVQNETLTYSYDGIQTIIFSDSLGHFLPIIGTQFELNWKPNNRLKFHNNLEERNTSVVRMDYLFFRSVDDPDYKVGQMR